MHVNIIRCLLFYPILQDLGSNSEKYPKKLVVDIDTSVPYCLLRAAEGSCIQIVPQSETIATKYPQPADATAQLPRWNLTNTYTHSKYNYKYKYKCINGM